MIGHLTTDVASGIVSIPFAIDTTGLIVGIVGVGIGVAGMVVGIFYARGHRGDIREARAEIQKAGVDIEKARKHIVKLRRQTLSALGLHEVIVTDPELEQGVRNIATQYARVSDEENDDPLLFELAHHKLYDTAQFMNMASDAHITWGSDSLAQAEHLASALLRATSSEDQFWASSVVDSAFWQRATAYLKQQEEHAAKKVLISRVFIFDADNPCNDEAIKQMKLQKDAGIRVTHISEPKFLAQDLVVVLKKQGDKHVPVYAMECRLGQNKHIDHVDLWVARGVQSHVVDKIWWSLSGVFSGAPAFDSPLTANYSSNDGLLKDDLNAGRFPRKPIGKLILSFTGFPR